MEIYSLVMLVLPIISIRVNSACMELCHIYGDMRVCLGIHNLITICQTCDCTFAVISE